MEKYNFILRNNNDQDGITEEIIDRLKKEIKIEKGYVFDIRNQEKEVGNIKYIKSNNIFFHNTKEIDNATLALDITTINSMTMYKDMAMNIVCRECGFDVYDRKYSEKVYYKHLKYWNQFLIEKRINLVISLFPPHHIGEYILFTLSKVKGIKTYFLYPQLSANGIAALSGSFFNTIGENIKKEYDSLSKTNNYVFSSFLNRAISQIESSKVMGNENKNKLSCEQEIHTKKYTSLNYNIRTRLLILLSSINIIKYDDSCKIDILKRKKELIKKIKKQEKENDHKQDYKRFAIAPNYDKKYIYFALQMTPEASTMPLAGEFRNQLLSIEILSKIASILNIDVYVKEHWVQYSREKGFYEYISKLPNVYVINLETNSIELTKNSLAVCTQTGNVIFESLVLNKPAIVFGDGYSYKGSPNIIKAESIQQLISSINELLNGKKLFTKEEKNRYLKSLDDNLIYYYGDNLNQKPNEYIKEDVAEKIVLDIVSLL